MIHIQGTKSKIPVKILTLLTVFIIIGFVLVAGCSILTNKNTKAGNSSSLTITPSITPTTPVAMQTTVPNRTETPGIKKGELNVSIGNYNTVLPLLVFIDNVSAGNVSRDKPLNLTPGLGRHTVRICEPGTCIDEGVVILSSNTTSVDFGERLKNEIIRGPLSVSIGGYNAELPVFVDNASAGKVTGSKPLNLMVGEGHHNVKVCAGNLCENETVEIKFAQQVSVDFGERLKRVAEFSTPTIRIVDFQQDNNLVTVDVELINPSNKDLTMNTTIRCTYSYNNPRTHTRDNSFKLGTISRLVKAGTREVRSLNLYLTGGSEYIIEIPAIVDTLSD